MEIIGRFDFPLHQCLLEFSGSSKIAMADLLTTATMHRGPMSKQFDCESGDISNLRPRVILKFVVQLFY